MFDIEGTFLNKLLVGGGVLFGVVTFFVLITTYMWFALVVAVLMGSLALGDFLLGDKMDMRD